MPLEDHHGVRGSDMKVGGVVKLRGGSPTCALPGLRFQAAHCERAKGKGGPVGTWARPVTASLALALSLVSQPECDRFG